MKLLISSVSLYFLSCSGIVGAPPVYMKDAEFVENARQYSPDSSMMLLTYSLDVGTLGYSKPETAVLKLTDTSKNLRDFSLPGELMQIHWVDNRTISATEDAIPSIRAGKSLKAHAMTVNGVTVNVTPSDYIEAGYHMQIESRQVSPDGRYELVAYRYLKDFDSLNFIHISIIAAGGQIPKYGNYLIGDMQSDYVLNAAWTKQGNLLFYSNELFASGIQYCLVSGRPEIPYSVVVDEKVYGSKYRWVTTKPYFR